MRFPASPRHPLAHLVLAVLAVAVLVLAAGAAELGEILPEAAPEEVGLDAGKMKEFSETMHGFVDRGELAGMVTAVARRGKLVNFEAFGHQDLANEVPMTRDTIFRIYSMTKPIVGVAMMTQYEKGKFQLDDPVAKYIPSWKDLKVAKEDGPDGMPVMEDAAHQMTIRELMTHTGGLTYGLFSRSQVDTLYQTKNVLDRNSSLDAMVAKLAEIPLRQQPGTQWHYSVSVDVQGYLVEQFTGKPLDQALAELIFEPLGMDDTGFWVPEDRAARFSKLYVPANDGTLQEQPFGEFLEKPGLFNGGGGLVSTAEDYLRFCQMLLNGGELAGARVLQPETVDLIRSNHLPEGIDNINPMIGNPGNVFGLGFAVVDEPADGVEHPLAKGEFWWYGIGGTWFGIHPEQELIVLGMIQSRGGAAARNARLQSKQLVYSAITDAD